MSQIVCAGMVLDFPKIHHNFGLGLGHRPKNLEVSIGDSSSLAPQRFGYQFSAWMEVKGFCFLCVWVGRSF